MELDEVIGRRCQVFEVMHCGVAFYTGHACNCPLEVLYCVDNAIGFCDGGICDMLVLEVDSVGHLFCICFLGSADMCLLVVWGGVDVSSIDRMVVPGSAHTRFSWITTAHHMGLIGMQL